MKQHTTNPVEKLILHQLAIEAKHLQHIIDLRLESEGREEGDYADLIVTAALSINNKAKDLYNLKEETNSTPK